MLFAFVLQVQCFGPAEATLTAVALHLFLDLPSVPRPEVPPNQNRGGDLSRVLDLLLDIALAATLREADLAILSTSSSSSPSQTALPVPLSPGLSPLRLRRLAGKPLGAGSAGSAGGQDAAFVDAWTTTVSPSPFWFEAEMPRRRLKRAPMLPTPGRQRAPEARPPSLLAAPRKRRALRASGLRFWWRQQFHRFHQHHRLHHR